VIHELSATLKECDSCKSNSASLDSACEKCMIINTALSRYAQSNIPLSYWKLEMSRDFKGDPTLLNYYNKVTSDFDKAYSDGVCVCFAGPHGVGKTFACTNILKRAVERGFSSLYVTVNDIVNHLIYNDSSNKMSARNELLMVDFLVIDEFDPRFMPTASSSDLFGRIMEDVFRCRAQNKLPIFMCTNSPNIAGSFEGSIGLSLSSLMNYVSMIPVLGKDFRKEGR